MAIDVALEVLTDPDFLITLTLLRSAQGDYVDGIFVPGTEVSPKPTFLASVQPSSPEDFKNMEEGEREESSQVIYSLTELFGSKDVTEFDTIEGYLGSNWKVIATEPWGHHGYFKSLIVKLPKGQ